MQYDCGLVLVVVNDIADLEAVFYTDAYFEYKYDTHFVIIIEDQEIDVEAAFKTRILKESHYLVLLKPISSGYAAYRSNLQRNGNAIEFFDLLANDGFKEKLFNPKLSDFNGAESYGFTTAYEPFVIVKNNPDGTRDVSGFDHDIFYEISKSVNAKPVVLSEEQPYYYGNFYANITGSLIGIFD